MVQSNGFCMKKRPALCTLSNKRVCFQCLNPTFVLKRSAKATYSYYISASLDTIGSWESTYNLSRSLKFENFSKLAKFRFAKFWNFAEKADFWRSLLGPKKPLELLIFGPKINTTAYYAMIRSVSANFHSNRTINGQVMTIWKFPLFFLLFLYLLLYYSFLTTYYHSSNIHKS